jgi:hypothetical protein
MICFDCTTKPTRRFAITDSTVVGDFLQANDMREPFAGTRPVLGQVNWLNRECGGGRTGISSGVPLRFPPRSLAFYRDKLVRINQ